MKKISLYAASLVALGLGFTSCDQLHNDLRLEVPTSYTLETPENANQLIIFGQNNSNVNNQLNVVTYNPYNVQTVVDFQVQVAKSEADFKAWETKLEEAINNGSSETDFVDENGLPYATFVSGTYTSPSFTVPGADFCDAINALYGFETSEQTDAAPVEVAYRVYAWIPGVEYSFIFSNPVVLPQVQTYIPIRDPRALYLIGAPSGWDINSDSMKAVETEAGSNIYAGTFHVSEGQFQFRFYSELGNWEENSIGAQMEDNPVDIEFEEDNYFGEVVVGGKDSWQYKDWTGGNVDVVINLVDNTISMTLHAGAEAPTTPTILYLIGAPSGWDINNGAMYMEQTAPGSGIYMGRFDIEAGQFQFRFYSALGNWDTNSIGSQVDDNPIDISFTNEQYTGDVVVGGKGSWQYSSWEGGRIAVTVNLNDNSIKIAVADPFADPSGLYIRGGMNSWNDNPDYEFMTTAEENTWVLSYVEISAGTEFKIADSNWSPIDLGGANEGDTLTPGTPYTLVSGGKNLSVASNFSGSVTLTKSGDTYSVLLTSN